MDDHEVAQYEDLDGKLDYERTWRMHKISSHVTVLCFWVFFCGCVVTSMVCMVAMMIFYKISIPHYMFYIDVAAVVVAWLAIITIVMRVTAAGAALLREKIGAEYWAEKQAMGVSRLLSSIEKLKAGQPIGEVIHIDRAKRELSQNTEPRVRFIPHCNEYKVGDPCPVCGAKEMGSLTVTFCRDFACDEEEPHLHGQCSFCAGEFLTCLDYDYSTIEEEP